MSYRPPADVAQLLTLVAKVLGKDKSEIITEALRAEVPKMIEGSDGRIEAQLDQEMNDRKAALAILKKVIKTSKADGTKTAPEK